MADASGLNFCFGASAVGGDSWYSGVPRSSPPGRCQRASDRRWGRGIAFGIGIGTVIIGILVQFRNVLRVLILINRIAGSFIEELIPISHGGKPIALRKVMVPSHKLPQAGPAQNRRQPVPNPGPRTKRRSCSSVRPSRKPVRIAVQRTKAFCQCELVNATFQVALFGDQVVSIIAQGEIIHAVHLRLLIVRVELSHLVQRADSPGPILGSDQLLRGGKCFLVPLKSGVGVRDGVMVGVGWFLRTSTSVSFCWAPGKEGSFAIIHSRRCWAIS